MKKIVYVIAAFAALCACSKDFESGSHEMKPVTLKFDVGVEGTKAYVNDESDKALDKVQVMVFNSQGDLETTSDYVSSGTQLSLSVIPGTKTLWAVGNLPSECDPDDLEDLLSQEYLLTANTPSKMLMSERKQVTITQSGSIQFNLQRLACKIVIEKIVRNFNQAAYAEIPLYIKKIYLSNVSNLANIAAAAGVPSNFCVQKGVIGNLNAAGKALLVDEGLNETLYDGTTYSTAHTFYAYPNGVTSDSFGGDSFNPRRTRLIVECEYNGSPCYYPITLPGVVEGSRGVLERNKVYRITQLTLLRPGAPNPDEPEGEVSSLQTCTFTIQADSWNMGHSYTETFS